MHEDIEDNSSHLFLREMVETQNKREQDTIDRCRSVLTSGQLPTPDSTRREINSLVGEKRQAVLRYHVFWKESRLRRGIESLVNASHQASIDICRHDAALGELAPSENFQDIVDYRVGHAAQKDVVAYCSLVFGVRDTLEEIGKLRCEIADDISQIKSNLFESDISEFMRKLRNNLLHGRVVVPQWEISYGAKSQFSTGSMMYYVEDLIQSGEWNDSSRKFILAHHGKKVQLSTIVREHFRLLLKSIQEYKGLLSRNVTPSEKDYFDIEDGHKRQVSKQWIRIMIGQMAEGKNPYDYLHRFFAPEALREILRYPSHSREQVDFMMALKADEMDWDNDLRNMMYRLFEVAPAPSA